MSFLESLLSCFRWLDVMPWCDVMRRSHALKNSDFRRETFAQIQAFYFTVMFFSPKFELGHRVFFTTQSASKSHARKRAIFLSRCYSSRHETDEPKDIIRHNCASSIDSYIIGACPSIYTFYFYHCTISVTVALRMTMSFVIDDSC